MRARIWLESEAPTARALGLGVAMAQSVLGSNAPPVAIYGAGLAGDSVVLGAWQHAAHAVRLDCASELGTEILRRRSGGPACVGGHGIVYVALALRDASTLLPCPPDRVLNRNLRGAIVGLSRGGAVASYGGREFLSIGGGRPGVLVAWDRSADGRVLVELFVARTRVFTLADALDGYAPRATAPMLGKQPTTLAEAWGREPSALEVLGHVVDGWSAVHGLVTEPGPLTGAELSSAVDPRLAEEPADPSVHFAQPREVPIGLASAGVGLDDVGRVTRARIAGDFYQDRAAPAALESLVTGRTPSRDLFAHALSRTFAADAHVIEGVRGLDVLADALADATTRANAERT